MRYVTKVGSCLLLLSLSCGGGPDQTPPPPGATPGPLVCPDGQYDLNRDPSDGCEYKCTKISDVDEPDSNFVDSNCDGIDGDMRVAIFVDTVGGLDTNNGQIRTPVRTISIGLAQAVAQGKPALYVSEGNYQEEVTLVDGISIYGQYSRSQSWARGSQFGMTLRNLGSQDGISVGIRGRNILTKTILGGIEVMAESGTATGDSSYGMLLEHCPGLEIHNSLIFAGSAASGLDGSPGTTGSPGLPGRSAFLSMATDLCGGSDPGAGGGKRITANDPPFIIGIGGDGGMGGGHPVNGVYQFDGYSGKPSPVGRDPGGVGGAYTVFNNPGPQDQAPPGGNGADGRPGATGLGGFGGIQSNGRFDDHFRWNSDGGLPGLDSFSFGTGGGGGGGSGRVLVMNRGVAYYGNAGGGGGSGGGPGGGGSVGTGGGASIGIVASDSDGLLIVDSIIVGGSGGAGGAGGMGGSGGPGGVGGEGWDSGNLSHTTSCGVLGHGGRGGKGGDGGQGGQSGGAAGGPSVGIYRIRTQLILKGSTFIFPGNPGRGGGSLASPGEDGFQEGIH